jgi:hypothetical protein
LGLAIALRENRARRQCVIRAAEPSNPANAASKIFLLIK